MRKLSTVVVDSMIACAAIEQTSAVDVWRLYMSMPELSALRVVAVLLLGAGGNTVDIERHFSQRAIVEVRIDQN